MGRTKNPRTAAAVLAHKLAGTPRHAIAAALNVSEQTVTRYSNEALAELDQGSWLEFQRSLDVSVPNDRIIDTLDRNMVQTDHLPTSQNAVMLAVKLKYGKFMQDQEPSRAASVPLFSLPAGSKVAIQVGPAVPARKDSE